MKILLAYSGGLDTTAIVLWLREQYGAEVATFTADVGQGAELDDAREAAQAIGASEIFIEDLQESFAKDYVWPMFRGNTVYEGQYLLGTAIARPLIAKRLVEICQEIGASAIAHGCTGKGNDQARFELGVAALAPEIDVIAPWRLWDMTSRSDLHKYLADRQVAYRNNDEDRPDYSIDANLLHTSYEGGCLEDLASTPPENMWQRTAELEQTPETAETIGITFSHGDAVAIDGKELSPAKILAHLNDIGGRHGVGRLDIVENRFLGIKSRGCYETPGGTVLLKAHRTMESVTLDGKLAHLKDELMPRYAEIIYNGLWWSPEREALQQLIDYSQRSVSGTVTLQLYKGNVSVVSIETDSGLYDSNIASFEDDQGQYDQRDAGGFIRLQSLRLVKHYQR